MARNLNLQKLLQEDKLLREIYKPTDLKPVELVLEAYLKYVFEDLPSSKLVQLENKYKIRFDISKNKSEDFLVEKAEYHRNSDMTIIILYVDTLERIVDDVKLIDELLEEVKGLTVHEDTHRQQYTQGENFTYETLDYKENLKKYITHYTEVDAYARQVGYLLKQEFPNSSTQEIFDKIKNDQVKNPLVVNRIQLYQSPEFYTKESRRFFHTLYQYLDNQEKGEN